MMKPLHLLFALAPLGVAACEPTGQTRQLPEDPSPYAAPVEEIAEPTDGMLNEVGPDF